MLVVHHRHAGNVSLMSKTSCAHIVWTWPFFWIWINPITLRQLSTMSLPLLCYLAWHLFPRISVGLPQHLCHPPLIYKCVSSSCPAHKWTCVMWSDAGYFLPSTVCKRRGNKLSGLQPLVHCFPQQWFFSDKCSNSLSAQMAIQNSYHELYLYIYTVGMYLANKQASKVYL